MDTILDLSNKDIRKILVVSDSHGDSRNLLKVIKKLNGHMDLMIHLGDIESSPKLIEDKVKCPLVIVRGNCDYGMTLPDNRIVRLKHHTIFCEHGRYYSGEYSLESMQNTALMNDADIIMVGHTHMPYLNIDEEKNVTVVNPGSISKPRQADRRPSYLVVNVKDDGKMEYVHVYINKDGLFG